MDHGFRVDRDDYCYKFEKRVLILSLMDHGFRGLKEGLAV